MNFRARFPGLQGRSRGGILLAMLHAALRWMFPLLAMLVVGPLAGGLTSSLRGPDGGSAATLLVSTSGLSGILAGVGVVALAAIWGALTAKFIGAHDGLFSAGLVLAWGTWSTGTIDQLVRAHPADIAAGSTSIFTTLALEGAVLLPLAFAAAWLIIKVGRAPKPESGHQPEPKVLGEALSAAGGVGLLAAIGAGGVVVYLVAQESTKGQTFAAAVLAGVAAAGLGRVLAFRTHAAVFVGALAVLAIASPLSALAMHGSGGKSMMAAQAGRLFSLARPLPLDWIAGAFVGVPLGLAWASSAVESHKK